MAIDLSGANTIPWAYTAEAVTTTWTEVLLPSWCDVVVLIFEGEGGYFAFSANGDPDTPEEPADEGAVGTHRSPVTADAAFAVPMTSTSGRSSSIFIARTGTEGLATITLYRGTN